MEIGLSQCIYNIYVIAFQGRGFCTFRLREVKTEKAEGKINVLCIFRNKAYQGFKVIQFIFWLFL